jgi:hypothetical protein
VAKRACVLGAGGGGGGLNRPSAYASNPCLVCVAAARAVSEAHTLGGASPLLSRNPGCGGAAKGQRACGPLLSRPLPASQGRATALCFSLLSTARPAPACGEACVRTRCWGPRRAGERFCFRGSRAMPLWPAAGVCGASLSYHPSSFAVSLAVMSADLATSSRGRRGCARRARQSPRSSCRPCAGPAWACMGGGATPANASAPTASMRRRVCVCRGGGGAAYLLPRCPLIIQPLSHEDSTPITAILL